jgi:hypothetical protein
MNTTDVIKELRALYQNGRTLKTCIIEIHARCPRLTQESIAYLLGTHPNYVWGVLKEARVAHDAAIGQKIK